MKKPKNLAEGLKAVAEMANRKLETYQNGAYERAQREIEAAKKSRLKGLGKKK